MSDGLVKKAAKPLMKAAARGRFVERYGPWAVVTGASSGIGEETARQLAALGLSVVLVARRRDRLEALAADLAAAHGVEVRVSEHDLASPAGVEALITEVRPLDVGLLVNNAGFGMKGGFVDLSLSEQRRMIELNCQTPVALTHGLGARIVARGRGGIIFVSSTAAFQGLPTSAVYGASKGFDLLLGEAVWDELRKTGVDVLTLCPGPTDTEGPRRTGVDPDKVPVKMMQVGPVVRAALLGLGKRAVVVPGASNRVAALLTRLVPRAMATRVAGRLIRRVTGE